MKIKHTSGKSRSHLTTIVPIHAEGSSLAESLIPVRELTEATSGKDRGVSRLEVLVNNEPAVVDQAIVVNGQEDILIYISVASRYEDPSF